MTSGTTPDSWRYAEGATGRGKRGRRTQFRCLSAEKWVCATLEASPSVPASAIVSFIRRSICAAIPLESGISVLPDCPALATPLRNGLTLGSALPARLKIETAALLETTTLETTLPQYKEFGRQKSRGLTYAADIRSSILHFWGYATVNVHTSAARI
jgi:hypothetical protein